MEKNFLSEQVCNLPRNFYGGSNKSAIQLLIDAGFYDASYSISRREVFAYLQKDPTLVNDWLLWSENKRVSSGWYFTPDGVVGYSPSGPQTQFPDKFFACAEFIVREMREFQKYSPARKKG